MRSNSTLSQTEVAIPRSFDQSYDETSKTATYCVGGCFTHHISYFGAS